VKGIKKFLDQYISGNKELPLKELLPTIGCELRSSDGKKEKEAILEAMNQELKEIKNPSPSQLNLRKAWMYY
jgi:hypothetical protein